MQMVLDKKIFQEAFNAVELKGKWFTATGLKSDILGSIVKIMAKSDEPKRGYHFINANNQTFVDYWIPAEIENDSWAVIDIVKAKNYLKNMNDGLITLQLSNGATFFGENRIAEFPTYHLHSNEGACDSFFRASIKVTPEDEIEWGEFPIKSGFIIPAEVLKQSLKSCENVGHGVYKLMLDGGHVEISSSNGPSERYAENFEPIACWGESATVEYTGPIHTAFKGGLVNCHFNDDSLLVMQNSNLLIARAPYVVV
tara:strand:- start:21 stop:785 length:765 start_codon:yes stop_codon:yes gene_type:complete